jgi:putative heme-binding domain-containing protein
VKQLAARLADEKASDGERISAARGLANAGDATALKSVAVLLTNEKVSGELQQKVMTMLGETGHAEIIAGSFGQLGPKLKSAAFDLILGRPDAALALLAAVENGSVKSEAFGPGSIARLRSHPDKRVSAKAGELMDRLNPGGKAKAEIIAKLTLEVAKPGNVENGRNLFAAACAVCHKYGDLGTRDVGPPLTGMGSHGAAELLIHIVDPNREVDPSFWQWNITAKDGATFAGVVTSENAATVTLRNQGGDFEIRKDTIAKRENTHQSLMPEGLEGLGAEGLRDILVFMTAGEGRYRVLDLRGAYTADGRRGLFASEDAADNSVFPVAYGNVEAEGLPFFLMDPARSADGKSLVVLKGGNNGNVAKSFPQRVEIPVAMEATRFYLLSGIAGWGYPAVSDPRPAMKATLEFDDGRKEETILLNRIAFSDYIKEVEVPGSKLLKGFVKRGQMRMIRIDAKKPGKVTKLVLESMDNFVTPVVAAVTADLSNEPAAVETTTELKEPEADDPKTTAPTGAKFAEPKAGLRVLLAGAGSSHDFPRFFLKEDSAILKAAGGIDVAATPNGEEALQLLAQADVIVFSGNDPQYGMPKFQRALNLFADAGRGIVILHAGTWYNYPAQIGYNARFVGGGTKSHGKGDFDVAVLKKEHPVMKGVSPKFTIFDESYRMEIADPANVEVLAENHAEGQTHPSVWVKKDPKARIVGITLGHDERAHGNPEFRKVLVNAVKWVGSK